MKPSYCYFIQSGTRGPVKIGLADNLVSRLATLQTGNPHPLHLAFAIKCPSRGMAEALEKDLHSYFKSKRIRGEWFRPVVLKRAHKMSWLDLSSMEIITSI